MKRWPIVLISCLPIFVMAAEPSSLGRLFLTPTERAALDVIRQNSRPPERIVTPANTGEDEESITDAAAPPMVSVQGYVKRGDGKGTVWLNGQPVQEKSAIKNFEVGKLNGNTNDVQVKISSTGKTIKLKAGQSYDPEHGKVLNNLRALPPDHLSSETLPAALPENLPAAATTSTKR